MTPLALVLLLAAATPGVKASASKTDLHVGEAFVVEVTASGPAGTAFEFPKEAGSESVELRTREPAPGASPPPPGVHRYDAMALALGDVELPGIEVPYRLADGSSGKATTEPLQLRVESVLPKDPKQQKLVDIRGPLSLSIGAPFWIALGLAVLLVGGVAFWLWRRRRPVVAPAEAPQVEPDAEALQALDRLAGAGLVERAEYRAYYIALAEIAKRYLERRLGAPVLEMTSAEMAAFLRDHAAASTFATSVRDLAGAADQVKFARGAGLEDEARRHLESARAVVRGIEDKLRPREQVA
ncbi:MAG TPA: DUF4381 family protein [Vicinamibacteria bacterium]|nr:DUF4381 family protein [Vicinamibacteria bacterium]